MSNNKWKMFKNYLHNELDITKEDIERWVKEKKEKRAQKREEKRERQERRESVTCPYCHKLYKPQDIHKGETKKEDIKYEKDYESVSINFMKCDVCKKLFGIESVCCFSVGTDFYRSSFQIEDKE